MSDLRITGGNSRSLVSEMKARLVCFTISISHAAVSKMVRLPCILPISEKVRILLSINRSYYGKQELSAERYRCFVKISLRGMGNVRFPEICVLIFVPQKI